MISLPLMPAIGVDFFGSAAAIVLSFLALRYSWSLVKLKPSHIIWGFLFYFCAAMAVFSLSRGVGHIIRVFLQFSGQSEVWKQLSPFSGGFNTMLMISAAAVTIYYHKGLEAYKIIRTEAEKLADANTKLSRSAIQLQELNSHLEEKVEKRTRNLSESEKKFRNFIENSKDIIYFCDQDGEITSINSSGQELLGFDASKERINFYDLFTNENERQTYISELTQKGFISDMEIECHVRDGSTRHLLLTANTLYDQDGRMIGCEGIGKDMTRLKTITEQLINHEKMASVGQMAAGVAHEINTPLGIILGYTQLMMDDFEKDSESHANLQVVERQSKACRRIVSDLLKFSRQAESIKALIDINKIIQEVLAVTEHSLNIQQIEVIRRFDESIPPIVGDAEKLHQVFINLFNNSQHAMTEGGKLTVITDKNDQEVLVSIIDTGGGIPEKFRNKIFDPFFTTKDVGKGTGLGLSVTYGIIQEHGGAINFASPVFHEDSDQPTPGTAFYIRLPAADPKMFTKEDI